MKNTENLVQNIVVSVDPKQVEWIASFLKQPPRVRHSLMRIKMGFDNKYYRGKADRDHLHSLNDYDREVELDRRIKEVDHECEKLMLNHEQ